MAAVAKSVKYCASLGSAGQHDKKIVQELQAQLTMQHLYQDASHIMVQRAAQVEIDLDQTAAMLCDEMQQAANRKAVMHQLQAHLAWERENGRLATAAVCILDAELQQKARELESARHELFITRARLEHADKLLASKLCAVPAAADGVVLASFTAGQQAKSAAASKSSVSRPAPKLTRHNSSPACSLEPL